jgi:hypothetical protein
MNYLKDLSEGKNLFHLEDQLAESLKPVRPNPAFIDSLKRKLSSGSTTILERSYDYYGYLAIGLGLAAGALIIWLTRRMK